MQLESGINQNHCDNTCPPAGVFRWPRNLETATNAVDSENRLHKFGYKIFASQHDKLDEDPHLI
jgi:hypothetical protein